MRIFGLCCFIQLVLGSSDSFSFDFMDYSQFPGFHFIQRIHEKVKAELHHDSQVKSSICDQLKSIEFEYISRMELFTPQLDLVLFLATYSHYEERLLYWIKFVQDIGRLLHFFAVPEDTEKELLHFPDAIAELNSNETVLFYLSRLLFQQKGQESCANYFKTLEYFCEEKFGDFGNFNAFRGIDEGARCFSENLSKPADLIISYEENKKRMEDLFQVAVEGFYELCDYEKKDKFVDSFPVWHKQALQFLIAYLNMWTYQKELSRIHRQCLGLEKKKEIPLFPTMIFKNRKAIPTLDFELLQIQMKNESGKLSEFLLFAQNVCNFFSELQPPFEDGMLIKVDELLDALMIDEGIEIMKGYQQIFSNNKEMLESDLVWRMIRFFMGVIAIEDSFLIKPIPYLASIGALENMTLPLFTMSIKTLYEEKISKHYPQIRFIQLQKYPQ